MENQEIHDGDRPSMDGNASSEDNLKTNDPSNKLEKPSKTETPLTKDDEWEYVTGFQLYAVTGTVTLVCFIMLLDTSIVATATPRITSDFHSLGDVGWYGSSYLLSSAALTPIVGKLFARYSSKWTYIFFLILFELGSLICALAKSSDMLIVGRAVAGMGAAGLSNGSLTIISACVPLVKRAAYLGFMMSFGQMGILLGPLIGGALTQHASWRWCFWINIPAGGIVLTILLYLQIPDRISKSTTRLGVLGTLRVLDFPGFTIFAPTSIMCFLALQWGGIQYAWNSATIIGLFCGFAGLFGVFIVWEHKQGDNAMFPWSLIKQRIVWSSGVVMLFFFGSQIIISYYMAIYFQAVKGVSPTISGVHILPTILSQMVSALASGVLVGKVGYYLPFCVIGSILSTIGCGLLSTLTSSSKTGTWIGFQIVGGLGRGISLQMPIIAIQNSTPSSQIPITMSLISFLQTFGGALFLSFAETCFNTQLRKGVIEFAPGTSPAVVEAAGASNFRTVLSQSDVPGVLKAYGLAIDRTFLIAAGAAGMCFVFCWGMGWKDVRERREGGRDEEGSVGLGEKS